jgi:UMP-CMP kinase
VQHFDIVVFCDCPEKIAKERYLTRKLPGRLEDDEALFDRRYQEYKELNPEVVEYFRREGKLLEVRVFRSD